MDAEIQEYFVSVPDERRPVVEKLHHLILSMYPGAELSMKYKMLTYQVGNGWVAIANRKNYVSLYTCGYSHIAEFKEKHPKMKTGKGCINFNPSIVLPERDIERVISHAMDNPKGE